MITIEQERKVVEYCLQCGSLLRGHIDKKYCNESCKSRFHNSKRAAQQKIVRILLSKVRMILKANPEFGKVIEREFENI